MLSSWLAVVKFRSCQPSHSRNRRARQRYRARAGSVTAEFPRKLRTPRTTPRPEGEPPPEPPRSEQQSASGRERTAEERRASSKLLPWKKP
eukprot:379408-Pyramimonas_sp.AAC.1